MGYTWYIPGIYRVKTSIGYPDGQAGNGASSREFQPEAEPDSECHGSTTAGDRAFKQVQVASGPGPGPARPGLSAELGPEAQRLLSPPASVSEAGRLNVKKCRVRARPTVCV